MTIRTYFPTLVYTAPLLTRGGEKFRKLVLDDCERIREVDDDGRAWSSKNYPGGFTTYGSMSRVHKFSSVFAEMEKEVDRHVKKFAAKLAFDLSGRPLVMTDCWINFMPRGAIHSFHIHPISTISGTYYVRVPRGGPALKFEDPRLSKMMAAPPKKSTAADVMRPFVSCPAKAGEILLWESFLRHEVPMNTVDEERISVSFNYSWF